MQYGVIAAIFAVSGLMITGAVRAEEAPAPATLSFQYSGLKWTRTHGKITDTSGQKSERKATSLLSGDLVDSFIYATIGGKLNLYFYPFQDSSSLISAGYMLRDNLEVGVDLGLDATRVDEPKDEYSSDLFGAFATYTANFDGFAVENIATLDFTRVESTIFNNQTSQDDKSKTSGTFLKLSATAIVPIAKNAFYLAGFWLAGDRSKNHTLDSKRTSGQFGLMLAGLRIAVE